MLRAAGAALVVSACTWYGVIKAAGLRRQAKLLAAFLDSLRFIAAELSNRATPLPELCALMAETGRPEVRNFFARLSLGLEKRGETSFSQLWREALAQEAGLTLFQKNELQRPGDMLGRYDYKAQLGAIESCLLRLEPELRAANGRAREGLRLYTGLGLAAGVMTAAVML